MLDVPVILIYVADLARMDDSDEWDRERLPLGRLGGDGGERLPLLRLGRSGHGLPGQVRRAPLAAAMGLAPTNSSRSLNQWGTPDDAPGLPDIRRLRRDVHRRHPSQRRSRGVGGQGRQHPGRPQEWGWWSASPGWRRRWAWRCPSFWPPPRPSCSAPRWPPTSWPRGRAPRPGPSPPRATATACRSCTWPSPTSGATAKPPRPSCSASGATTRSRWRRATWWPRWTSASTSRARC